MITIVKSALTRAFLEYRKYPVFMFLDAAILSAMLLWFTL